ncbi:hypothetical protein KFL_000470130 [Klebsormidium nitens]|uniref:Uncharacterized protein n=1 Tax=Klebsormidium nitens TaxID=105231 RepID=A0A1Y1HSI1_KLENI|nr:hypothetical protein KFL_000470130 [Klebsormidium nitens]|eukprot:GAQ80139.1 hypothetical protein KFL_000470130 [Klebsormidium nitens]
MGGGHWPGVKVWTMWIFLAGLAAGVTQAAPVTDCNNLAAEISAAGAGGTVEIQGILPCSSPITIGSSVTLAGVSSNAANDGFDGQAMTQLFVVQGSGTQVNFNFLTLTNAKTNAQGGAVLVNSAASASFSNFVISNCVVNTGFAGAAVFIGGSASFSDGLITGSSSDYAGGAIFADTGSSLSLDNVQFTNNVARTGAGGAIFSNSGLQASFTSVTFDTNMAATDGGCVFLGGSIKSTFAGCTFTNCTSTNGRGGALFMGGDNALTSIIDTSFMGNQALGNGGAVFVSSSTSVTTLTNVQFTNNKATRPASGGGSAGGGMLADGDVSMQQVTMTGNTATLSGGGLATQADRVRITMSDIEGNDATFSGGGVFVLKGNVQIDTTKWHITANNTVTGTNGGNPNDGSRDVFVNEGGFAYFCDELPWPGNTNPHTVSGPYSLGCPGYNNTTPIPANKDCVSFLTALQNAPNDGTGVVNFTDVIRFDALTCGTFSLPFVISKSVTIQGASDNPLYNTLDAYNNNALFRVTGTGVRVFFNRVQLTRGVGGNGPAISVESGAFVQTNNAVFSYHQATGNGGAIYLAPGTSIEMLSGTTLTNNIAKKVAGGGGGNGGAVYGDDGSKVYLYTVTMQFNKAEQDGGSLWVGGRLDSFFTTMSNSNAGGLGGCAFEKKSSTSLDGGFYQGGLFQICNAVQGGAMYIQDAQVTSLFTGSFNNTISGPDNSRSVFITPGGLLRICSDQFGFNFATIVGPYETICPLNIPDVASTCPELLMRIANPVVYSYDGGNRDPAVPTIRFTGFITLSPESCPAGTTFPIVIDSDVAGLRFLGDDANPQFNQITGNGSNALFKTTNPNGIRFERLWLTRALRASGNGACLEHTAGPLTILNVNFQDCIATNGNGGAVYLGPGTSASTTSFAALRNYGQFGGAMYTESNVPVIASGSGFFQGGAYQNGGGIYVQGPFSASRTSITSNMADAFGAGLYMTGPANVQWNTGSFDSNTAGTEGGGAFFGASTIFKGVFFTQANNQRRGKSRTPPLGGSISDAGYLDTGAMVTLCQYTGQNNDQGNNGTTPYQYFAGPGKDGLVIFDNQDCTNVNSPPVATSANPPPVSITPSPPGVISSPPSDVPPPPFPTNVACDPASPFKFTCYSSGGDSSICCDTPCPETPGPVAYCSGQPFPTLPPRSHRAPHPPSRRTLPATWTRPTSTPATAAPAIRRSAATPLAPQSRPRFRTARVNRSRRLVGPAPPPVACSPYSPLPYTCYDSIGSSFICCGEPCPGTPGPIPACTGQPITAIPPPGLASPPPPTPCDPASNRSNTCYNSGGSTFVCCDSPCPATPSDVPFCSAQPIVALSALSALSAPAPAPLAVTVSFPPPAEVLASPPPPQPIVALSALSALSAPAPPRSRSPCRPPRQRRYSDADANRDRCEFSAPVGNYRGARARAGNPNPNPYADADSNRDHPKLTAPGGNNGGAPPSPPQQRGPRLKHAVFAAPIILQGGQIRDGSVIK